MKFEDLIVGQYAETNKTVTENDVIAFADVSGDRNPVHLDAGYAATTPFKERIVHGALIVAYVSGLIGMELPGRGSILISLVLKCRGAVKVGSTVRVRVEVKALDARRAFVRLACFCYVGEEAVIKGQALVSVPRILGN